MGQQLGVTVVLLCLSAGSPHPREGKTAKSHNRTASAQLVAIAESLPNADRRILTADDVRCAELVGVKPNAWNLDKVTHAPIVVAEGDMELLRRPNKTCPSKGDLKIVFFPPESLRDGDQLYVEIQEGTIEGGISSSSLFLATLRCRADRCVVGPLDLLSGS